MTSSAHCHGDFVRFRIVDGFDYVVLICCVYNGRWLNNAVHVIRARSVLVAMVLVSIATACEHAARKGWEGLLHVCVVYCVGGKG